MARSTIATETWAGLTVGSFPTARWADLNGFDGQCIVKAGPSILSNYSNMSDMRPSSGTYANDQGASLVLTGISGNNDICGVIARASADTKPAQDCYRAYLTDGATKTLTLSVVVNGTETVLGTNTALSASWANGDTIEIECEGTTIRALRNGTAALTFTNSALTSGRPGVCTQQGGDVLRGGTWTGFDITSGTPGNASGAGVTANATAADGSADERIGTVAFTGSNRFIDESGAFVTQSNMTFYVWRAARPSGNPNQIITSQTITTGVLNLSIDPGSLNNGDSAFLVAFAPDGSDLFWAGEVTVAVS